LLRACTASIAIVIVALLTFVPLSSNDFWLQSAIGRMIWTSGEIPFTEASEFRFHAHECLSSVVFYLLHDRLGYENLIFVKGALGLALFGLSCRLSHRLTGSFVVSIFVSLVAMAAANFRHFLRPELFGLLFTLIVLSLLHEYKSSGKWRYLLGSLPVALLWANCHGSFPVALLLAGIFAAGAFVENLRTGRAAAAAWPYALCGALMMLAMLANPHGLELFRFAWELQSSDFVRSHIYEWMPTFSRPFLWSRGFWAFAFYLAFVLAALWKGWKALSPTAALVLIVFGTLALQTQRHITLFAFASVYPLSMAVAASAPRLQGTRLAGAALPVLLAACAGLLVRYGNMYGGFPYSVESRNFSPLLVEFVENNRLRGNVLNSYALGAELVYRFYPRLRPAIDSRIDVYGEKYFLYVRGLNSDEQALTDFLERYRVGYMLLLWPEFDDGIRRMSRLREDGWRIVFADDKMVLLGRL